MLYIELYTTLCPPKKNKYVICQAICICRNDDFADSDRENACDVTFMEKSLLRLFTHEKLMQNIYHD